MFNSIGPLEIILVLVVVLLIFGPKRLPQLGRQLGGGMREFKDSVTGKESDREYDEEGRLLTKAQPDAPAAARPVEQHAAPATPAAPAADAAPEQRG
jgi:sec-independent protein translocase protein TatA